MTARGGSQPELDVVDLGTVPYQWAYAEQQRILEQVAAGERCDTLLLLEHPHVITLGRSREAAANVLASGDVEVVQIERGGDVTYHGPGQLVAYPIVALREHERDLHAFMRRIEDAIIASLLRCRLAASRAPGNTGVWVDGRKLASIGIACRRWVTWHGLALNVSTDLSYFGRINPCGFQASVMTSVVAELGDVAPSMEQLKLWLAEDLCACLARQPRT
ncbi:MAG: octanoyltransferase [Rickettsiales bacterium]|nr:octanoyltransferase [Rickettsiales bacterium]